LTRSARISNYVPRFHGQLDYILYARRGWRLLGRRRLPTARECRESFHGHLPRRDWPSDHVAVVADLELRPSPPDGGECPDDDDARGPLRGLTSWDYIV